MKHSPIHLLEQYIIGKDQDKYEILEMIYAENAEVEFEIYSKNITFPSRIVGRKNIAKVLSADFNKNYERVKTYYLSQNSFGEDNISEQKWLVVMKDVGCEITRVGCGYYNWEFSEYHGERKIVKHKIYIHTMLEIEDTASHQLQDIQAKIEYPWVQKRTLVSILKDYKNLEEIIKYLIQ